MVQAMDPELLPPAIQCKAHSGIRRRNELLCYRRLYYISDVRVRLWRNTYIRTWNNNHPAANFHRRCWHWQLHTSRPWWPHHYLPRERW